MRRLALGAVVLFLTLPSSCSIERNFGAGGAGGAGGGGAAGGGSGGSAGSGGVAGGSGGAGGGGSGGTTQDACGDQGSACLTCIAVACCAEVTACNADPPCKACLEQGGAMCSQNALFSAVGGCTQASCNGTACGGPAYACNPVTQLGCAPVETCSVGAASLIACGPDGPSQLPCGSACADDSACAGGLKCVSNLCTPYCCTDADCGTGGVCQKQLMNLAVGTCSVGSADCASVPASPPSFGYCIDAG